MRATQKNSSPYCLHDEANDYSETHAATHHSYYYSCDFTCRNKTHSAMTDGGKPLKNTSPNQNSFGVIISSFRWTSCCFFLQTHAGSSDAVLPEESSFPDSTTNKKLMNEESHCGFYLSHTDLLIYLSRICCSAV